MNNRLVIIGANDFQNQLILKAKSLGFETHVFAWRCGDIGEKTADYFYPISIVEKEKILEKCREIHPLGIISIASDLANITVNYVAEKLGLICNGIHCTELSTNKHAMRECFMRNGIPSPQSYLADKKNWTAIQQMKFPLIVKPVDRSGSRGIYKVWSRQEMNDAIEKARTFSFAKDVLVEEFVEGNEYSVEYVSVRGNHYFLGITKKYTTGSPNFIETGHIQPAFDISSVMTEKVRKVTCQVLDALEIKNGASHTELKINKSGEIKVIECGSRMGGDCIGSDLVYLSSGVDFLKLIIQIACDIRLSVIQTDRHKYAGVYFIFNKNDLNHCITFTKHHPDLLVRKSDIENIDDRKVMDSASRYGYYLFVDDTQENLVELMRGKNEEN